MSVGLQNCVEKFAHNLSFPSMIGFKPGSMKKNVHTRKHENASVSENWNDLGNPKIPTKNLTKTTHKLLCDFIETTFRRGCSHVNLLYFLRTPFKGCFGVFKQWLNPSVNQNPWKVSVEVFLFSKVAEATSGGVL